jgi:hypothetical protein
MGEVPRWVLKRRSEERFLGCTDRLVSQLGITVGELLVALEGRDFKGERFEMFVN